MVFEKLVAIIAEQFGVEEGILTRETSFMDELNADSLDLVELVMSIEEEFDLAEMEDDTVANIKTVGDAEDYIRARMEQ